MKQLTLFSIFIFAMCINNPAQAEQILGDKYRGADNMWCVVDIGGKNTFYLCGDDGSGKKLECAGWDYRPFWGHSRKWYSNNGRASFASRSYTCCIKSGSSVGTFKSSSDTTENKTIDLEGGGKCTYTVTKNACGDIIAGVPCTEPTDCDTGYILRNGTCVKPCGGNMGFADSTSNECIECPTTDTQGVDIVTGECIKCNTELQFWNPYGNEHKDNDGTITGRTGKCIECNRKLSIITQKQQEGYTEYKCIAKTDGSLNKINKDAMKKCFPCQTQEHFKKCVEADGAPTDTDVRKSCLLPITD